MKNIASNSINKPALPGHQAAQPAGKSLSIDLAALGCPGLEKEFRLHPVRKCQANFAHLPSRQLIQIEGGIQVHGRHNRGAGFVADLDAIGCPQGDADGALQLPGGGVSGVAGGTSRLPHIPTNSCQPHFWPCLHPFVRISWIEIILTHHSLWKRPVFPRTLLQAALWISHAPPTTMYRVVPPLPLITHAPSPTMSTAYKNDGSGTWMLALRMPTTQLPYL